jgi:cytochrome c biogenesis protein CcdA
MFIIGLSLTFTAFGAAAGLLGTIFGVVGGWWYAVAGAVALVMGGQLMGLYEIRLPVKRDFKPKQGEYLAHSCSACSSALSPHLAPHR